MAMSFPVRINGIVIAANIYVPATLPCGLRQSWRVSLELEMPAC
jgi:hypothetical protein